MKHIDLIKLATNDSMSAVTKKVIKDFNSMDSKTFAGKYYCTKKRYFKRIMKYGDPYKRSPLSKLGHFLNKIM